MPVRLKALRTPLAHTPYNNCRGGATTTRGRAPQGPPPRRSLSRPFSPEAKGTGNLRSGTRRPRTELR